MRELLLVGSGGFLGSALRYFIGGLVFQLSGAPRFPVATLTVNMVGCLLIGIFTSMAEHAHVLSPQARLFLITGLLGGFTTFSAFGFETYYLAREQAQTYASLNILAHLAGGLFAVWLGHKIVEAMIS